MSLYILYTFFIFVRENKQTEISEIAPKEYIAAL